MENYMMPVFMDLFEFCDLGSEVGRILICFGEFLEVKWLS
jgi:hypothetical protein